MNKIGELRFDDLPTKVCITKAIRATYYKEGVDKLPKKYDNYYYDYIDGILCDCTDNTPVIKNANKVGTARYISIGGNRLQELAYTDSIRAKSIVIKIKSELQTFFLERIKPIPIKEFPIIVEFKFYINETNPLDRDNLGVFYEKVFFDCIQTTIFEGRGKKVYNPVGFIENDDIKHINNSTTMVFFTTREPYLIVNFYQYSNVEEYNNLKANIIQNKTIMDNIQEVCEKLTIIALRKKYPIKKNAIDPITGDYNKEAMKFYQEEYEFHFTLLSNAFL